MLAPIRFYDLTVADLMEIVSRIARLHRRARALEADNLHRLRPLAHEARLRPNGHRQNEPTRRLPGHGLERRAGRGACGDAVINQNTVRP